MRIRSKLVLWFALVAILPAVVITYFSYNEASRRFRARAREELAQSRENGRQELVRLQADLRADLRRLEDNTDVREFIERITAGGELTPDSVNFAERINAAAGAGLDFLSFIRDDGIVISSLEWKEFASYRDPNWDRIADLPSGASLVGPALVDAGNRLSLRALIRVQGIVILGGYAVDESLLSRFRTSARVLVFLKDPISGSVRSESTIESRMAAELTGILGEAPSPESDLLQLSSGEYFAAEMVLEADRSISRASLLFLYPRLELDEAVSDLVTTFALAAAVGVGLAVLFGAIIAKRFSDPLREMTTAFEMVALGDFGARLDWKRGDELGGIARAFNAMADDLSELRGQLVRTERIAAWQEIARKVAHEIKNPLSPIKISIETLRKARSRNHPDFDAIFVESTDTILEEVEKIRRIVSEFSDFARLPEPDFRPTELRDVVEKVLALCQSRLEGIRLVKNLERLPPASADPDHINRMLMNLVLNAVEALEGRGTISVLLEGSRERGGRWARLKVADDGPGMAPKVMEQVFVPYFTTKQDGSGLGLAIVARIVEQHRGRISIRSEQGRGTEVEVLLPIPAATKE